MTQRPIFLAAFMAGGLAMGPAVAQTVPLPQPNASVAPQAAPRGDASLSHSALKATTYKVATATTNLALFSAATGALAGGTLLTVLDTAASAVVFTVNDYLWDSYDPPPVKQAADQSFNKAEDAWRTTRKFLTYKPTIAAITWGMIYVYTGSATTMLVAGTASSLSKTALFYLNNFAWDAYDWHAATPAIAAEPSSAKP
jgi:uncharacterized membrane protein